MKSMYLMPSIVPTREPMRPPKIRKYSVMVIAGGTRVWPQMRRMRFTSRRTMVPSATKLRWVSESGVAVVASFICGMWVSARSRDLFGRGLRGAVLGVLAGQAHEQFFKAVGLGAHGTHADARLAQRGEDAVEVHRARHLDVERVVVGGDERGAVDGRQRRGQRAVDVEQEAFDV